MKLLKVGKDGLVYTSEELEKAASPLHKEIEPIPFYKDGTTLKVGSDGLIYKYDDASRLERYGEAAPVYNKDGKALKVGPDGRIYDVDELERAKRERRELLYPTFDTDLE